MRHAFFGFVICATLASPVFAAPNQAAQEKLAAKTESWSPVPKAVDAPEGGIPSDAIRLFDGSSLDAWESAKPGNLGAKAPWTIEQRDLVVAPGTGDIRTKQGFCDVQLHVEWQVPSPVDNGHELTGQDRNNSGIFLQELYEVQVLDSYKASTYVNGQAGSIYKQSIPLVNASRPPQTWQTYDIVYTAPRFAKTGKLTAPARITVLLNGVLVQNNFAIQGPTAWIGHPRYKAHGCAPLSLQDHGHAVRFRNIWIRPL